MSVPEMSESVIVLCDRIRDRALRITEEHNAQLRHAECGEVNAEHLAQTKHAACEELEDDNMQLQQAHAQLAWEEFQALQSSRDAWELVHKEEQSLRDEIRFAQRLQSEYEECEAHAHYQRHHHIPIVRDELQSQGLPIELHQNVAAKNIPLYVECQNLQRQLLWAEIESGYWHNTAKAALG